MSGLFRSMDMSYVAVTCKEDIAPATFNAIIQSGLVHLVDLTPPCVVVSSDLPASTAPSTSVLAVTDGESSRKRFKRRAADCSTWLRKLDHFVSLREARYRFLPPLPIVGGGKAVSVHPVTSGDVLDAAAAMWDPIEAETAVNSSFDAANQRALIALIERRTVLETLKDLDLNEEMERLQRIEEQDMQRQEAEEGAQKGRQREQSNESDASASAAPHAGSSFSRGIQWAHALTARSGSLSPPTVLDLHDSRNLNPTRRALGFSLKQFVCGTVPTREQLHLARVLFRVTRGNLLLRFHEIAEPMQLDTVGLTHEGELRSVFYVIFLGQHLVEKIKKTCTLSRAHLHELPLLNELEAATRQQRERDRELQQEVSDEVKEQGSGAVGGSVLTGLTSAEIYANELAFLDGEIADKRRVGEQSTRNIKALLSGLFVAPEPDADGARSSPLLDWMHAIRHEHTLCTLMQRAYFYRELVAVEGWCPTARVDELREAVRGAVQGSGFPPAMLELDPLHPLRPSTNVVGGVPPTAFPLTKLTAPFQSIVDTYGVPRFKEVNPALFTITTFPFLFGVMYGDVGHGCILAIVAIALCVFEKRLEQKRARGDMGEIFEMLYSGRYILLLMSLWSIYAGSVYNDVFSITTNAFGSGFERDPASPLIDRPRGGRPYPFGVDPDFRNKADELMFYNSLKMKISVILGVAHMMLGLCLSLCNHLYFRDYVSAIFEFGPRLIFLSALFVYLDVLIIVKWCIDWSEPGAGQPPNLIQTMIEMVLSPGHVPSSKQLYPQQGMVQGVLLLAAIIAVPLMLCVKPCWMRYKHKRGDRLLASRSLTTEPEDFTPGLTNEAASSTVKVDRASSSHCHPHTNSHVTRACADGTSPRTTLSTESKDALSHLPASPTGGVHRSLQSHVHTPGTTAAVTPSAQSGRRIGLGAHARTDSLQSRASSVAAAAPTPTSQSAVPLPASDMPLLTEHDERNGRPLKHEQVTVRNKDEHATHDLSGIELQPLHHDLPPVEQPAGRGTSQVSPTVLSPAAAAFSFSDELIHQAIHTIEFVLGTVSNTASYLRLWALSLAHQQLSIVFWSKMLMQYGIANENPIFGVIGYAVWAVATFAVLLCMDVLECFLHALRLHWVEFQNKFYMADGIAYEPITFGDTRTHKGSGTALA